MFRHETFGKYRVSSLSTCHCRNAIIPESRRQEDVSDNLLLDLHSIRAAECRESNKLIYCHVCHKPCTGISGLCADINKLNDGQIFVLDENKVIDY